MDDEDDTRMLLCEALRGRGFDAEAVESAQAGLERLRSKSFDVVVTDVQMPGMNGVELCAQLHERHPDLLPIVLTGLGALDTAVAAIRAGAYDFITKPVKIDALEVAVRRALEHLSVRNEVKRLRAAVDRELPIATIAGTSSALRATTELIRQVADSDATVLITG
ncbi:MAG: sigma-54-dependent Fis family transcriptional regulator, partial [Deltaproteobacteria bacterium]|nr:sigma-54-dependent Fis family transcriptional regulator [Deltaproteobacteria bacterium]